MTIQKRSALSLTAGFAIAAIVLAGCPGTGGKEKDEPTAVSGQDFWGRWVRMDGGTWNIGDARIFVADAAGTRSLSISSADSNGLTAGGFALTLRSPNLISVAGSGGNFHLFRGGEAGGFSAWVAEPSGAADSSRAIGLGGIGGIKVVVRNVINEQERYEKTTDADGNVEVPEASSGSAYTVTPAGGAAVTITSDFGGLRIGTVFKRSGSYLLKASVEYSTDQPFVFSDERVWSATIRISNFGTETAKAPRYEMTWDYPPEYNATDCFFSVTGAGQQVHTLSGVLPDIPAASSATVPVSFWSFQRYPAYAGEYWSDRDLYVTITDSEDRVWEDAVTIRFHVQPMDVAASALGPMNLTLVAPTNKAYNFVLDSPPDNRPVTVPMGTGWRAVVSGASSADNGYSLGLARPASSADALSLAPPATGSYEPNDGESNPAALALYGKIDARLSPADLDFYQLDIAEPADRFPLEEISVAGGTFTMGEGINGDYNGPPRTVTLSPFIMTATEVTRGQSFKVAGYPYLTATQQLMPSEAFLPLANVSWYGAAALCDAFSIDQGLEPVYGIRYGDDGNLDPGSMATDFTKNGWRLPTEAEWEYAARGGKDGTDTAYAGSDDLELVGWYGGPGSTTVHMVGIKRPNGLGFFDQSGNLGEWVNDWYAIGYQAAATSDPTGPDTGTHKGVRGGFFASPAESWLTVKARNAVGPGESRYDIGFRMVRRPD